MTARILDGNALSAKMRDDIAQQAQTLTARGVQPCLAVILVGEDPASAIYVRSKVAACEKAGLRSLKFDYPADIAPAVVFAKLAELNADTTVHGILVQLPLPPQFDENEILEAISFEKDVDGFQAESFGLLLQGRKSFYPCTPWGVMKMLEAEHVPLKGAEAVVVGRSNNVGKPMAIMLLSQGATVTVCHSQTKDLAFHTKRADIVVAAVGRSNLITGAMIKPGAVVIDIGMNRLSDGKLSGDVEFSTAKEVASLITPVPGGVGPMTITMLLANTLESANRVADKNK